MNDLSIVFDQEKINLIKRQILPGASDDELALFINQAQRTGLDPFSRQIYGLMRRVKNNRGEWESKLSVQVSIDGFRLIAERTGSYAGQDGPYWCGDDGLWKDVWLEKLPPKASKVGVYRHGFSKPLYGIALFDEYAQTYYDKSSGQEKLTPLWIKMPTVMIAKCAESLALRKAFPQELSNLYTTEEMGQASNGKDVVETTYESVPAISAPADDVPPPFVVPPKSTNKVIDAVTKDINASLGMYDDDDDDVFDVMAADPDSPLKILKDYVRESSVGLKFTASNKQVNLAGILTRGFWPNQDVRHRILEDLFGYTLTKENAMTLEVAGFLKWLNPEQNITVGPDGKKVWNYTYPVDVEALLALVYEEYQS